ncbi:hypothetical protein LXL04_018523 [Taraxacum kok-saghyz]
MAEILGCYMVWLLPQSSSCCCAYDPFAPAWGYGGDAAIPARVAADTTGWIQRKREAEGREKKRKQQKEESSDWFCLWGYQSQASLCIVDQATLVNERGAQRVSGVVCTEESRGQLISTMPPWGRLWKLTGTWGFTSAIQRLNISIPVSSHDNFILHRRLQFTVTSHLGAAIPDPTRNPTRTQPENKWVWVLISDLPTREPANLFILRVGFGVPDFWFQTSTSVFLFSSPSSKAKFESSTLAKSKSEGELLTKNRRTPGELPLHRR